MVLIGGKKRATNWMNLSQLRRAVWLRRLARREALILLRYQRFLAPHESGAALKEGHIRELMMRTYYSMRRTVFSLSRSRHEGTSRLFEAGRPRYRT